MAWWGWLLVAWCVAATLFAWVLGSAAEVIKRREEAATRARPAAGPVASPVVLRSIAWVSEESPARPRR